MQTNIKSKRIEARLTIDQKELFQHAAHLLHCSLTEFMLLSLTEKATQTINEHEIIQLSLADQKLFAQAILHPSKPNKALVAAVSRYKKIIKSE